VEEKKKKIKKEDIVGEDTVIKTGELLQEKENAIYRC
jgi:hypothetical protein